MSYRIRRGQRIDEDMDAVVAGEGGDAEIGNDEPLRRELAVVVVSRRFGLSRHDIDARLQVADGLVDRKRRGHILVEGRSRGGQVARPDPDAALIAEVGELVAV